MSKQISTKSKKMNKFILILIASFLLSCGSKHKLVEESKVESTVKVESTQKEEKLVKIDSSRQEEEFEMCYINEDSTSTAPLEIIKPDGTKILIPKGGKLSSFKKKSNKNYLQVDKAVSEVKQEIGVTSKSSKREKIVNRDSFFHWLVLLLLIIFLSYMYRKELRTFWEKVI